MPENKVTVVALFRAKPGKEEAIRQAIEAVIAPTRAEPGCINYDLHQSTEDPSVLMLYENWNSKKDLDEHLAMPYLKGLLAKADDLLAEPIDIKLYRMISQKE
jgi:quinol monooxygenase YgiN